MMTEAELDQCRKDGALLRSIVAQRIKLKRKGREWKGGCPFHDDADPSFTVYDDGHFHCYGCNAHGTVFDFVMRRDLVDFPRAAEIIASDRGASKLKLANGNGAHHGEHTWLPIVPAPPDVPKPTDDQLRCDMLHEYFSGDDRLLCYVRRYEARGGKSKQFYPLTYGSLNGSNGWHDKAPAAPKPLYRLNVLSHAAPDATVILCEGEKKADAVQRMFPDMIGMSWMGGANADASVDFSPLSCRPVILWPDADEVGRSVMARIAKRLPQARTLDTSDFPDGYDAADLERDGCGDPGAWLNARLTPPLGDDHAISLAALKNETFEPIKWIVPEYIPEGLTVFAGKPKIGKSWLMLGTALGVARGTETLGKFVQKGDVLYCGLEDGKRRMQSRVEKVLGPSISTWPENFIFRDRLDPLDAGGLDVIEQWLITHPNRRLVVIDTLARVRGMKNIREEQYQYDYRLLGSLHELTTRYRVAIVVVHHVRKTDAEDVLDTVSGTTGIAGAADTVIVLGKTPHGVRFYLRGRDAEEQDKLVEFDHETGLWSVTGEFEEAAPSSDMSGTRRAISDLLDGSPVPLTPANIAERLGKQSGQVRFVLYRMLHADPPQVIRDANGTYARARSRRRATGATGLNTQ